MSVLPQVGDDASGYTNDVCRGRTEVVVPRSRCRPHFVVLQQVWIYEHAQLGCMTKGRHATVGLSNLWIISASMDFGFKTGFRQNAQRLGTGHRSGATTPAIPHIERTV